jgi:hypothetical protein
MGETVGSVVGFTQPVLEDVLGRLPVVGAGFQAVSLCLSAVSTISDSIADGRHVAEVTSEVHILARHAVMEMMSAAMLSPYGGDLCLRQLALTMDKVENASATLDKKLVSNVAANAVNGPQLGPVLVDLRSVGRELVSLKSFRNTREVHAQQDTNLVTTNKRLDGLQEGVDSLTLGMAQGGIAVEKDEFTPAFNVPDIPNGVHLDFSFGSVGMSTSMEGMLKAAVMKHDAREVQSVAAVSSATKHLQLASV